MLRNELTKSMMIAVVFNDERHENMQFIVKWKQKRVKNKKK